MPWAALQSHYISTAKKLKLIPPETMKHPTPTMQHHTPSRQHPTPTMPAAEVNYMQAQSSQANGHLCKYHGPNRSHTTTRCKLQPFWDPDICAEWRDKRWCFLHTAGKCLRGDCANKHLSEAELQEHLKTNLHPHYESRSNQLEIPEELSEEDIRKGATSTIQKSSQQREQYFITRMEADPCISPVNGRIMSDSDDSY